MIRVQYIPSLSVFGSHAIGYFDAAAGKYAVISRWVTEIDAQNAATRANDLLSVGKIKPRSGFLQATRTTAATPILTFDAYTSVGPVCCKDLAEAVSILA